MRNKYKILFLLFAVIGVYSPILSSGFNSADDYALINGLNGMEHLDLKGLFLPESSRYYRPLLILTFILDKYLWGLKANFMHLENILIHALNTVLVFLVARKVFAKLDLEKFELPLFSALLFALHPINTEAVNWISGRTDPLAATFVLLSALALTKGLDEEKKGYLLLSSLGIFLGCFVKEVAFFFFPAACLLVFCWHKNHATFSDFFRRLPAKVATSLPFVLGAVFYLLSRHLAIQGEDAGIQKVVHGNTYDLFNNLLVGFKTLGFYVKKLFLPVPLNFTTIEVADFYAWIGIAALLVLILIACREHLIFAFLATSLCLIFPAILNALSQIAWTPVAERYLYLPSAFFAIGITGGICLFLKKYENGVLVTLILALPLFPATYITAQRNIIWQDNLTLYQDTVKKSPDFPGARNELAIALWEHGNFAEANAQFEIGRSLDAGKPYVHLYINQARLKLFEGKPEEAKEILLEVCEDKTAADPQILKVLAEVDEERLLQASLENERN